jgi:hypothetical protein
MPDDWFEDWFGEEYLALYEHRDHHEAREVAVSSGEVRPGIRNWKTLWRPPKE